MNRPKVSAFLAMSLDGHLAAEGGGLSWLDPYASDSAEDTGYACLMREVDTMVIGRRTCDQVLDFAPWPFAGKPTALPPSAWRLQDVRRLPSGLLQTIYRSAPPDGPCPPGSPTR